jgi:hypothetical protein
MWWLIPVAFGDCAIGGLGAYAGPLHPERPEIVVELHRASRDLAVDTLALVDGERRVPLLVVSRSTGARQLDQLVLTPAEPLSAGTWRLAVPARRDIDSEVWKGERVWTAYAHATSWTLGVGREPVWERPPTVVKVERVAFGCGPAVSADVDVGRALAGAWVHVKLEGPTGAQEARVLVGETGVLSIGHGMCSGLFTMAPGAHEATLSLVGGQGPSQAVAFEVP